MLRLTVPFIGLVIAAGLMSGCGSSGSGAPAGAPSGGGSGVTASPPVGLVASGKFTACQDLGEAPYAYQVPGTGQNVGIDVQVAGQIAKYFGLTLSTVNTPFNAVIAALQSNKCDAIVSGMSVSDQRKQEVSFVQYASLPLGIMKRKAVSSPSSVSNLKQLSGLSVAVQLGTLQESYLQAANKDLAASGKPKINITDYPSTTAAIAALGTGKADFFFAGGAVAEYVKTNPKEFVQVSTPADFYPQSVAVAVKKGNSKLAQAISIAVKHLYDSGALVKDFTDWSVKNSISTADAGKVLS